MANYNLPTSSKSRKAKDVNVQAAVSVGNALPGREAEMVRNTDGGGMVFTVTKWDAFRRFLIMGAKGKSYYEGQSDIQKRAISGIDVCLKEDGKRTVDMIVDVSLRGLAAKNDGAVVALAYAASAVKEDGSPDVETRRYALANLSKVCRTSTHLFDFLNYVETQRGWGRGLRTAVSKWYTERSAQSLGYQLVKYRQRNGWSQRDVIRKSRPVGDSAKSILFALACNGYKAETLGDGNIATERRLATKGRGETPVVERVVGNVPRVVEGYLLAQTVSSEKEAIKLILDYGITQEMLPTEYLNKPKVAEALLQEMMPEAMIRNLGRYTSIGLFGPNSESLRLAVSRLTDAEALKKARIHPINVLNALRLYSRGYGDKSDLRWNAVPRIVGALNDAFYKCFEFVEPTGKRLVLALDVSGSMSGGSVIGSQYLRPYEVTAAMAMVTARTEEQYEVVGFSHNLVRLNVTANMSLEEVLRVVQMSNFGSTNPGAVFEWAMKGKVPMDGLVVYTDNEVNCGHHPSALLKQYRQKMNIPTRMIVCGTSVTDFTIADPTDRGQLDIAGFSSETPALISNFLRGEF